jgi:hypothetical protein
MQQQQYMGISNSTLEDTNPKQQVITTDIVERTLRLKQDACIELTKVETCQLDIFNLDHVTAGNELVTVTAHLLAKENIF